MQKEAAKIRIGRKIRQIREIKGIKQEYIAQQIGLSQNGYSDIETGKVDVNFSRLEMIANALEIDLFSILSFDDGSIFNNLGNGFLQAVNYGDNNATNDSKDKIIHLLEEQNKMLKERIASLENEIKMS